MAGPADDRRRTPARPPRERVTSVDAAQHRTDAAARAGRWSVGEAETLFTSTLMRAHGRLALACLASFAMAVVLVAVVMSGLPEVEAIVIAGVPLSWLIHAYGFYPLLVGWAVAYALACGRLERRFRQLVEHE